MLRDRLNKFSDQIAGSKANEKMREVPRRYQLAADALGGELCSNPHGTFVKIVNDFNEIYAHGGKSISQLDPAVLKFEHFADGENPGRLSSDRLLFFDMETTGLGGSGTVPFLIGFGSITSDGFQLRQYFLPDYPDEAAMLEAVRQEISRDSIIVSYNGKAFDMPILVSRLILNRVERNLEFGAHVDLLHSVRRLYKRRLKDCSLSNIEREVLGYFRYDDIPGYLVPSVYFNWLSTDETSIMKKVIRHNIDDIISLLFVIHHIGEVRDNPAAAALQPDDLLSLARILEKRGEHDEICGLLAGFGEMIRANQRYDLLFLQALAFKRAGVLREAVAIWEEISGSRSLESFLARVELAKFYEHQARDIRAAMNSACSARENCPASPYMAGELERRINRLERKLRS